MEQSDWSRWRKNRRILIPSIYTGNKYILLKFLGIHIGKGSLWKDITEEDYRKARRQLLADYCMVTKLVSPRANHIIGIATEPGTGTERSEDLVYLDASTWNEDQNNEAKQIQDNLNLFTKLRPTYYHEDEYPIDINQAPQQRAIKRVKNPRNKPCPCGSGKKYKRCCGR